VLGENLTEHSKKQLTMQVEQYGHQIHFMHTDALIEKMRMLGIPEYRGAYATNMKMFVTDYLNDDIDRLLYIDSDTIICGDISSLIFLDMENKPIGMVLDSLGARHKLEIGLNKQDDYFNGGVILYDVRKWRQDKWTEKIQEHVKLHGAGSGHTQYSVEKPDQENRYFIQFTADAYSLFLPSI